MNLKLHKAMKRKKNFLSWSEAWSRLLSGEIIAAYRLSSGAYCYLRNQAWRIGRELVDSGTGAYRTFSLN